MKNKITSIGEILYDIYPDQKRLGGAPFNFIYHIWKILGSANFISSVGDDENGKEILSHLNSIGFNTKSIIINKEHSTGTVLVTIDEHKVPHFKINWNSSFDYMTLDENILDVFENETDILSFGTFSLRNEVARNTILSLFNKPGKKYFCDLNLRHNFFSKELIEKILQTSNVIKVNQDELDILKSFFQLDKNNSKAVYQLMHNFEIDLAAVTLGKNGAELYSENKSSFFKPTEEKIIDTLGAGDAFSAILCLGYLHNTDLDELNKLANNFALKICQINGAIPIDDSIYLSYQKYFSK